MTVRPDSSKEPKKSKPADAMTPERREGDPGQPDGCSTTPGGGGAASGKPACPEGYPEEQQSDDPTKRPDRGAGEGKPGKSGETPGDRTPDQRER